MTEDDDFFPSRSQRRMGESSFKMIKYLLAKVYKRRSPLSRQHHGKSPTAVWFSFFPGGILKPFS